MQNVLGKVAWLALLCGCKISNVINSGPEAVALSISTNKNITATSFLNAYDDKSNLKYSIVSQPLKGRVSILNSRTGAFSYTPNRNEIGEDRFTFEVSDGEFNSDPATVTIDIINTFSAPVATGSTVSGVLEDQESQLIILPYSDIDDDLATQCSTSNLKKLSITQSCSCDSQGV